MGPEFVWEKRRDEPLNEFFFFFLFWVQIHVELPYTCMPIELACDTLMLLVT